MHTLNLQSKYKVIFLFFFCVVSANNLRAENKSNPIVIQRDLALLSRWEDILLKATSGNTPWYRSFQNFVAISYKQEEVNSNLVDYLIHSILHRRPDIMRNYCVHGYCRLDIYKNKAPEMLTIVREFKKKADVWDYHKTYTCTTFSRRFTRFSANATSRFIYRALSEAVEMCIEGGYLKRKTNKEECWTNVHCDSPEFQSTSYRCTTKARTFSDVCEWSIFSKSTELGLRLVAETCSDSDRNPYKPVDETECLRNAMCEIDDTPVSHYPE